MSLSPSGRVPEPTPSWADELEAAPSGMPLMLSRGRLAEIIREAIHADAEARLQRTESVIGGLSAGDREALCEWLGGMLHRAPLERPTRAFAPMAALIDALWWDIAYRTPDPLEPDALSPAIIPNHPWGPGADAL